MNEAELDRDYVRGMRMAQRRGCAYHPAPRRQWTPKRMALFAAAAIVAAVALCALHAMAFSL